MWVTVETTHVEEGDRTRVEMNHNPEDARQLGLYDVQCRGSQVSTDCGVRKVRGHKAKT